MILTTTTNTIINTSGHENPTGNIAPPDPDATLREWAQYYIEAWGWGLTPLHPGTKEAYLSAWQDHPLIRSEAADEHWQRHPDDGIGVVLAPSGLCTLDVDDPDEIDAVLARVGICFDDLLTDSSIPWIIGQKMKAVFRLPQNPPHELGRKVLKSANGDDDQRPHVIFELRAGPHQDVLPPSIHPCGSRYEWRNAPWECDGLPELPEILCDIWYDWDQAAALMSAVPSTCPAPSSTESKIIRIPPANGDSDWSATVCEIRRRMSLDVLLLDLGAQAEGGSKYLCPFHDENHASFWTWTADDHERWHCAHGNAPVGLATADGSSQGDVIDLYQYCRQVKTRGDAIRELAQQLALPLPTTTTIMRPMETPLTDLGNAERIVAQHGENIRYCHDWKSWLIWDGRRWERDQTQGIMRLAKDTIRQIYQVAASIDDEGDRKRVAQHAFASESRVRQLAAVELAQSDSAVAMLSSLLDQDPWLLSVANGTMNLRDGVLQPHSRDDYITKQVNVPYDPEATCPLWREFLHTIMDEDDDRILFLQKLCGYALTGDTSEQCLIILIGTGANGKSVFLETVQGILGEDYAKSTPTETILSRERGAMSNDVARLKGVRLVTVNEVDEGRRMGESQVKQLTGGDTITARPLYGEFTDFSPEFKLFIRANHRPTIRGTDHAIWRRIRIVPFEVTISPEERDPHLKEKLAAEAEGILAWMVAGCRQWLSDGLGEPEAVNEATAAYKQEMDIVAQFLDERTEHDSGASVGASELYRAFSKWCDDHGERAVSSTRFGRRLTDRGLEKRRTAEGIEYKGIRLFGNDTWQDPYSVHLTDSSV